LEAFGEARDTAKTPKRSLQQESEGAEKSKKEKEMHKT